MNLKNGLDWAIVHFIGFYLLGHASVITSIVPINELAENIYSDAAKNMPKFFTYFRRENLPSWDLTSKEYV